MSAYAKRCLLAGGTVIGVTVVFYLVNRFLSRLDWEDFTTPEEPPEPHYNANLCNCLNCLARRERESLTRKE